MTTEIKTIQNFYAAFCLDCNSGLEYQFMFDIRTAKTGIFVKPCKPCSAQIEGLTV